MKHKPTKLEAARSQLVHDTAVIRGLAINLAKAMEAGQMTRAKQLSTQIEQKKAKLEATKAIIAGLEDIDASEREASRVGESSKPTADIR